MTLVANVMALALSGGPELIVVGVLAVLALLAGGVAVARRQRAKTRGELPTVEVPQIESKPGKPERGAREQVDGPVEIDKKMSLAEIKAAKSAVLSKEFKNSDEAQAAITLRKTGGVASVTAEKDAPAGGESPPPVAPVERPLAVTPVAQPAVAPGAANDAPTAPQRAEDPNDAAEIAAREADTTQAPAVAPEASSTTEAELEAPDSPETAAATEPASEVAQTSEDERSHPDKEVTESAASAEPPSATTDEATSAGLRAEADKPERSSDSAEAPEVRPTAKDAAAPAPAEQVEEAAAPVALSDGLAKTRGGLFKRLGSLFTSKEALDEDLFEELEELLFTADIGVKTSQYLLQRVQQRHDDGEVGDAATAYRVLREEMSAVLHRHTRHLDVPSDAGPQVWLMVGVNGAGKTTTVGKLAAQLTSEGKSVLMVAGDTFRAAAVGQLERWAERVGCGFHSGADEADPSSVIFDGVQRAKDEGVDIVLCDTAGRLQTKTPLMDELSKIGRVAGKALDGAPHETILVVDANTGQNAIQQARLFGDAVPLTGMILTKLDGTAKGGVVLGISQELDVPIYHIGIGEGIADLRRFDADEFVEALFL